MRAEEDEPALIETPAFPFLFGGTFIEGISRGDMVAGTRPAISLPFRRDFH